MDIDLRRELVADVPTMGLDLGPGERRVRAFFKGPAAGIDANTGLIVILHGIGGRQNDISYKIIRKELADAFNVVVAGVNYLGTDVFTQDDEFIRNQLAGAERALAEHAPDVLKNVNDTKGLVWLEPPDNFFIVNQRAALEIAKPRPDDFWDYGYYQAIDVLSALDWLKKNLGDTQLHYGRAHLLSQSSGAQTAMMCIKLAPRTFVSLLDLGGALVCGEAVEGLRRAFTDPFRGLHPQHMAARTGVTQSGGRIKMVRKHPVAFANGQSCSGAPMDDEVAIRDAGEVKHFTNIAREKIPVHLVRGHEDEFFDIEQRCGYVDRLRQAGMVPQLLEVTQDMVEMETFGKGLFRSTTHELIKDFKGACLRFGSELWKVPGRDDVYTTDIGSDAVYSYATPGGVWTMRFLPVPLIAFQSSR